jgi:acyl dehydratase
MKEFRDDHLLSLDDLQIGQRFVSGTHVVEEEQIKAFAFDPQPFHLDNEAAKDTLFSGLAASGWHTAGITMRLLVESGMPLIVASSGLAVSLIGQIQPGPVTACGSKVKCWTSGPRDPIQIEGSPS